jgi:hypothetical protein
VAKSKMPLVLTAVGALILLRNAGKGIRKSKVREEVIKHRNKLYKVGPNCEIEPRHPDDGGVSSEQEEDLLWVEYVEPIVAQQWTEGVYKIDDLTTAVMDDLFREEQCIWPPPEGAPMSQVVAFAMMHGLLERRLSCEADDTMAPGERCIAEQIDPLWDEWVVGAYKVAVLANPWMYNFLGFIEMGAMPRTIYYRGPAESVA